MWCQNCRTYIPAGATVCPGCGKPVAEVTPEEAPRQVATPLDPASAPPGAPSGVASPWLGMNYSGPPPTSASPYNPNQPQGGAYSGYAQPSYQQGVQTSWPGGPPREAPVLLGLSRRELVASGAGGILGLLLGGGGVTLANGLLNSTAAAPAQFWAYATTSGANHMSLTVIKVGAPTPAALSLKDISAVATNRTAADILALAVNEKGKWTLRYLTAAQLIAFPSTDLINQTKNIDLKTPSGAIGQVYDVRALTDQTGKSVAIVVAMTDGAGAPQVALQRLDTGAYIPLAITYTAGANAITDLSFIGPALDPGSGGLLYLRVAAGASQTVIALSTNSIVTPKPHVTIPPIPSAGPKITPPSATLPPTLGG